MALAVAITRFQPLYICVANAALQARVQHMLADADVDLRRVRMLQVAYDDTWLRDSGPITLLDADGHACLNDFRFTGWGGKFEASQDDALITALVDSGVFGHAQHRRIDWALEGGAVESDGRGSVLTTWQCLHQRHPQASRGELETKLRETLAAHRVLWLDRGFLIGDDTDAHIDTLARFAADGSIVFQSCDDPNDEHFAELAAMRSQLASLRTPDGQPYTLHALPWPRPILDGNRRLAASYANYLVINGAVLAPSYDDPADEIAAEIIRTSHPGREVIPIPCRDLIWQNGSLHCLTMQLPAGLLA